MALVCEEVAAHRWSLRDVVNQASQGLRCNASTALGLQVPLGSWQVRRTGLEGMVRMQALRPLNAISVRSVAARCRLLMWWRSVRSGASTTGSCSSLRA